MSFKNPNVLSKDFFLRVRSLSQPKLRIYQSYFEAFIKKLNLNQQGIVFDGFAGQGVYKNDEMKTNMVDLGSPLLALIPGIHYLNKNKQANLKYVFVEKNEENFKVLVMNVNQCIHALLDTSSFKVVTYTENNFHKSEIVNEKYNLLISLEIHNDEFKNHIDRFCDLESHQRLISIVDPFGYKDLDVENIEKLVGKNKDIFITFMANLIKRYRQIETHQETISNILNIDRDELVDLNNEVKIAVQFGNRLNEFNSISIDPLYLKIRNTRKVTIYVLLYISSDELNNREMAKCFNQFRCQNDDEYEFSMIMWREKDTNFDDDCQIIFEKIAKNGKTVSLVECKKPKKTKIKEFPFKKTSHVLRKLRQKRNQFHGKLVKRLELKSKQKKPIEYEVEKILNDKVEKGTKYYLIKWKYYSHKHNTWEPIEHLNCSKLLKDYNLKKDESQSKSDSSSSIKNLRSKSKKFSSWIRNVKLKRKKRVIKPDSNLDSSNESESNESDSSDNSESNESDSNISDEDKDIIVLSSDDEEEVEPEVEIISDKKYENDKIFYLVKYKNSNNEQWVLKDNLNCDELIDQFEAEILQNEKEKFFRKSFEGGDDDNEIKEYIKNKQVERIVGMGEKDDQKIFAIKLVGLNQVIWVPKESANKRCPQNVIKFYQSNMYFAK